MAGVIAMPVPQYPSLCVPVPIYPWTTAPPTPLLHMPDQQGQRYYTFPSQCVSSYTISTWSQWQAAPPVTGTSAMDLSSSAKPYYSAQQGKPPLGLQRHCKQPHKLQTINFWGPNPTKDPNPTHP